MAKQKQLIIHADDLGLCDSVNRASFELFEKGCISSASAMVVGGRFEAVAQFAHRHPKSDIGVHLTILSDSDKLRYRPLSPRARVLSLLDREGYFLSDRKLLKNRAEPEHVIRECSLQISKAMRAGLIPTHLDGHRDAFSVREDIGKARVILALEYGLPFRPSSSQKRIFSIGPETPTREFLPSYVGFLDAMKPGLSQLVVHPGLDGRELRTMFGKDAPWGSLWRQQDYEVLRARPFRKKLKDRGIRLVGWKGARQ